MTSELQKRANSLVGREEACSKLGEEFGNLLHKTGKELVNVTLSIQQKIEESRNTLRGLLVPVSDFTALARNVADRTNPGFAEKQIAMAAEQLKKTIIEKITALNELSDNADISK